MSASPTANRPRFPIYVLSKGRAEATTRRLTVKALSEMGADFRVVVEEQEFDDYAARMDPARLLILDPAFQEAYDTCDDLGGTKSRGSGPARNFAWEHAIAEGHARHWVMDDNITGFRRVTHGKRLWARTQTVFYAMETFALRFDNVALAGPQYEMFLPEGEKAPPFVTNTRIQSCILIDNSLPFRWRARYNEDVDLSLRCLKAGLCTVQFNAFLQNKLWTNRPIGSKFRSAGVGGGGNSAIYLGESGKLDTLPKSRMLVRLHPDVARLTYKFERWHHTVDYSSFVKANRLKLREGVVIPEGADEMGMRINQEAETVRSARIKAILDSAPT